MKTINKNCNSDFPKIDLKRLDKEKEKIFKERLSFIDRYIEYIKKHPNQKWSSEQKKEINAAMKKTNKTVLEVTRMFFDKGAYEYKLENAIKAYYDNNLCLTGGARLAGISKREFMDELARKGVGINLDEKDYDYSKESMNKLFGSSKAELEKKTKEEKTEKNKVKKKK